MGYWTPVHDSHSPIQSFNMRTKIIAGNWKMNGDREDALSLATEIMGIVADEYMGESEIILFPPFVHIQGVARLVENTRIKVGAQDCSAHKQGAYTGEVAASMLKSVGANYVIIGHSERRSYFNESSADLSAKIHQALDAGLKVIYCVGETLTQRQSGDHFEIIQSQLSECLYHFSADLMGHVVIAYEPVWAIGTGATATTDQAQEMHSFIRKSISNQFGTDVAETIRILYGGSCNENNAQSLFSMADIDGGLIGGASLKSRSFVNILKCS